ncbi:hypothetical protein AALA69_02790 [Eggerthellaceae bacterium 24-137]
MAERYSKMVKGTCSIAEAVAACKAAINAQKMNIKYENVSSDGFNIEAAEKTNWLSTSWPAKVEITGQLMGDKVLITIELQSTMGSITQAKANSSKADMLADNIKAILE